MARERDRPAGAPTAIMLEADVRNLVPLCPAAHAAHHNRSRPLRLAVLPDSVFEFAAEVLGAGRAFEYLRRRYVGEDARLDALLPEERQPRDRVA